jgi:DMSO/TMAO reductase YedYZ molybdopterin-dependent catalytic subunit
MFKKFVRRLGAILLLSACVGLGLAGAPAGATSPAEFGELECMRLRQAPYATTGIAVPADGIVIPVPLALDFGDGKPRYTFLMLDEKSKAFHFNVPSQRVKVTFNPGGAILARVAEVK